MQRFLLRLATCMALCASSAFVQQAKPGWPVVPMAGPAPAEELITVAMTRPISTQKAPPGCAVLHTERYCRDDKRPVRSFKVLEQRTSESSSVEAVKIDKGCLLVTMKLAVPRATRPGDMCLGGEPRVELKIQVSTKAP